MQTYLLTTLARSKTLPTRSKYAGRGVKSPKPRIK